MAWDRTISWQSRSGITHARRRVCARPTRFHGIYRVQPRGVDAAVRRGTRPAEQARRAGESPDRHHHAEA